MTAHQATLSEKIVDKAIELAEQMSWERVYLHQVAAALDIAVAQIYQHFQSKDELVEAWYDRADQAMLLAATRPGFSSLDYRTRLHTLLMAWLDFLATHKTVSRDMLLYKLEPAHVHLQLKGILRVSRTVQWLREAAGLDSTHLRRIAEEAGLTGIYLQTLSYWIFDHSTEQVKTRTFLDSQLARAERLANNLFRCGVARPTARDMSSSRATG